MNEEFIEDNHIDDHVDEEIINCFNKEHKKSFFMFAGAGSGKTRSLVNLLNYLKIHKRDNLNLFSQKIAVITYTNAACDEILNRVDYDDIFQVQTIHSFLWECIKNFQIDIKEWVKNELAKDIEELQQKQSTAKSVASIAKTLNKLQNKNDRLKKLENIKKFSYNPNGENLGYDSLNHAEVIQIGCDFIKNKKTMKKILVAKYPIILIDESQDTKKELVDALLDVYNNYKDNVIIGMFGDQMQRIYMDGKENLEKEIPEEWEKPIKVMNHRSAKRIVELANMIRKNCDNKQQRYRSDAKEGYIRLFICNNNVNKSEIEKKISLKMETITGDKEWNNNYQSLILEHHMAATRLNFEGFFNPIYEVEKFRTGILDGSLAEVSFFTNIILPLIESHKLKNSFEEMKIIKKYSKLIKGENISDVMNCIRNATNELYELFEKAENPLLIDILRKVNDNNLFELPERLKSVLNDEDEDDIIKLKEAFKQPVSEIIAYKNYITGETGFGTHQGIKGLEFPRVMVILDDKSSKGFLFSYEKLFGVKEKSAADIKNEREQKDTSITRTNRLFYVACTRAMDSLAVLVYTENAQKVKKYALDNNWFKEEEIEIIK
ncbi:MAG: AAA family ATPase [Clostridia bacterium]|jgi:DNA helicase-2/ATP-dependent DNA helicase PcrA